MKEGTVLRETKIGRHKQIYRGEEYLMPRLTLSGKSLQDAGFQVDDMCEIVFIKPGEILVRSLEILPPKK